MSILQCHAIREKKFHKILKSALVMELVARILGGEVKESLLNTVDHFPLSTLIYVQCDNIFLRSGRFFGALLVETVIVVAVRRC